MRCVRMLSLLAGMALGTVAYAAGVPATAPAIAPTTQSSGGVTLEKVTKEKKDVAATQPASVSPEAKKQLDQMDEAYKKLSSLDLSGKLSLKFDVTGEKQTKEAEFTSSFVAPNKFRQEVKDDSVVGSTGEKLYIYSQDKNVYSMDDAPKGKVDPKKLAQPFADVINTQNPSLMLALSAEPAKSLTENLPDAKMLEDVSIDGKAFHQLKLYDPESQAAMALLLDPSTHLVRRATLDISKMLEKRGAADVKEAAITVDYPSVVVGASAKSDQFAWSPPADAKDAAKEMMASEGDEPSKVLEGKPAPDFVVKNLEDKNVSLKDVKGQVVVLDFWATWCPPCREGLPHVDQVYKDFKGKGLMAFAVNQQEDKAKVKQYLDDNKLSLVALLDEGKVAEAYKVNGIPQTVVIGRDGVVKNVFVGFGPGSEEKLRQAVQSAVAEK